jgi:hypothetical protein
MTATTPRPGPSAPQPVFTRRRVAYILALAVAAGALVVAFMGHPEPVKPARPKAVAALSPGEGDTDIRQTEVFVELDPAFDGDLIINGTVIPKDQEDRLQTGNVRIGFTPGNGKEFSSFPAGRNCAVVRFWPLAEGEGSAATYSWCFNLH